MKFIALNTILKIGGINMKKMILALIAVSIIAIMMSGCVSSGSAAGTTAATATAATATTTDLYKCLMGRTPKVDNSFTGKFDDPAWQGAEWQHQSNVQVKPLESPQDADIAFACVADDKNLYIGFDITDDKLVYGNIKWPNYYLEDAAEFFIDPYNKKTFSYDKATTQITISASNIGRGLQSTVLNDKNEPDEVKGLMEAGKGAYAKVPVSAISVKTDKGWAVEVVMPLKNAAFEIVPKDGLVVGWNVQYDDDDTGTRDSMLVWSSKDIANKSWQQEYYFGSLMFVAK
jgi:hypothetical protein